MTDHPRDGTTAGAAGGELPRLVGLVRALDAELAYRKVPREQRESLYLRAVTALSDRVPDAVQDAVVDQLRHELLQADAQLDAR